MSIRVTHSLLTRHERKSPKKIFFLFRFDANTLPTRLRWILVNATSQWILFPFKQHSAFNQKIYFLLEKYKILNILDVVELQKLLHYVEGEFLLTRHHNEFYLLLSNTRLSIKQFISHWKNIKFGIYWTILNFKNSCFFFFCGLFMNMYMQLAITTLQSALQHSFSHHLCCVYYFGRSLERYTV